MLRTLLTASVAAAAFTGIASADAGDFRFSGGYTYVDVDDLSFDAASLRAGYDFTDYVGIEGQLDIGLGDETVVVGATNVDVSLDYAFGGYVVGRVPVAENTNLFGRLGYVTAQADASAAGVTFSDDDDGFAYGVGGEWLFDGRNGVRLDYTRIDFDNGGEADTFGVSYVYRFGAR
tara:strand:- start:1002 stop:1529 length:528 start_codon:yes stop_codon:yes gene_type:complete